MGNRPSILVARLNCLSENWRRFSSRCSRSSEAAAAASGCAGRSAPPAPEPEPPRPTCVRRAMPADASVRTRSSLLAPLAPASSRRHASRRRSEPWTAARSCTYRRAASDHVESGASSSVRTLARAAEGMSDISSGKISMKLAPMSLPSLPPSPGREVMGMCSDGGRVGSPLPPSSCCCGGGGGGACDAPPSISIAVASAAGGDMMQKETEEQRKGGWYRYLSAQALLHCFVLLAADMPIRYDMPACRPSERDRR